MAQDGENETTGISLFSTATNKRRRKEKDTADRPTETSQGQLPAQTLQDSECLDKQDTPGASSADRNSTEGDVAAERQTFASTSGQDGAVTFRSLGITEWLNR